MSKYGNEEIRNREKVFMETKPNFRVIPRMYFILDFSHVYCFDRLLPATASTAAASGIHYRLIGCFVLPAICNNKLHKLH